MKRFIAFLLLFVATLCPACLKDKRGKDISVEKAHALIQRNKNNPNFVILDVRTPKEYRQGHIKGAINLNFFSKGFFEKISKLPKEKTYLIYCRSGHRSAVVKRMMSAEGFKNIYNMEGGILAWLSKGYKTVKGEDDENKTVSKF